MPFCDWIDLTNLNETTVFFHKKEFLQCYVPEIFKVFNKIFTEKGFYDLIVLNLGDIDSLDSGQHSFILNFLADCAESFSKSSRLDIEYTLSYRDRYFLVETGKTVYLPSESGQAVFKFFSGDHLKWSIEACGSLAERISPIRCDDKMTYLGLEYVLRVVKIH